MFSRSLSYGTTRPRLGTAWVLIGLFALAAPSSAQTIDEARRVEIARRLSAATVVVRVGDSAGSGFVVGSRGHIVTNRHVAFGDTGQITVQYADATFCRAQPVAVDWARDVTILEPECERNVRPLRLTDSDGLETGRTVLVFGSPMLLAGSLTQGVVSAVRPWPLDDGGQVNLIQTDASINSGNSGGPMVDSRGRVVGVVVSKWLDSEGIAFAIAANHVRALLTRLAANNYKPVPFGVPPPRPPATRASRPVEPAAQEVGAAMQFLAILIAQCPSDGRAEVEVGFRIRGSDGAVTHAWIEPGDGNGRLSDCVRSAFRDVNFQPFQRVSADFTMTFPLSLDGASLPTSLPPREAVVRTFQPALDDVRKCAAGWQGVLFVRVHIEGPTGRVRAVYTPHEMEGTMEQSCVQRVVGGLIFPRVRREMWTVTYPFRVGSRSVR